MIDSQSVKTTEQGGPRGYGAGKSGEGGKRHIVVDTQGWLLAVLVHPADIRDRDEAKLVLQWMAGLFPDPLSAVSRQRIRRNIGHLGGGTHPLGAGLSP